MQRVSKAHVSVNNEVVGKINNGMVVLLGVGEDDTIEEVDYLVDKIINLRIFADCEDKMNLSLLSLNYELLVVSQFTLYGDCKKGRRPNFSEAAKTDKAKNLYEKFVLKSTQYGINVETGVFGGNMKVELINDGPVTFILDSR